MEQETFTLPPEIAEQAAKMTSDWQKALMFGLAEQMQAIGIDDASAVQIEINTLFAWAARAAMVGAFIIEEREPCRELWIQATTKNFDEALATISEKFPKEVAAVREKGSVA